MPPPPLWPRVIATTLRLWVQRHVISARLDRPANSTLAAAGVAATTYLNQLISCLDAQRTPLRAIVSEHRHGRTASVLIQFATPSPTGLLPASATQALTVARS